MGLSEYAVTIGGHRHIFLLSAEDAARYGDAAVKVEPDQKARVPANKARTAANKAS